MFILFLIFSVSTYAASTMAPAVTAAVNKPSGLPILEAQKIISTTQDRPAATQILIHAIEAEKNLTKQQALIAELHRLAGMFFTNEGQRLFELAESMRYAGKAGYQSNYDESAKLENMNWNILFNQGLGQLSQKKYKEALASFQEAKKIDPYKAEVTLMILQTQLSLGDFNFATKELEGLNLGKSQAIFKYSALAKKAFMEGKDSYALKMAQTAMNADSSFPMGFYWGWKILSKESSPGAGIDEVQKYLTLCKGMTSQSRRKYNLEPNLCADTEAAADYLAKQESLGP